MKSLLRLKPYLRPYLWMIITSGLLAIPLSALRASPVPLIKYFVDHLLVEKNWQKLYLFPFLILAIYFANFIVRFFHYYLLRIVIIRVNEKLKNNLFDHLLGLSADYYTTQSTGGLIARVGSDTATIDGGVSAINIIIREPITFIVLFVYALKLNWRLTLITLLVFPPLAWVFSVTGRNLKRYIHKMNEENGRQFSTLQETFTGIRIVKMFRLEGYVRRKFQERSGNFAATHKKTAILEEASHPMVELLSAFVIAAVVFYGGVQVLSGKMTPGDLMAFFVTFGLLQNPIRQMNEVNIKLNQAAGACERVFEIFDWKSRLRETPNPLPLNGFDKEIKIDHVTFAYPDSPERQVLKNVSFTAPKGSITALVGASGAGKSSMVSLLPRIFDVTEGKIEIDGHDIRDYKLDDLRRQIAVVSQDVFLFNDTIEENIRCGKLNATHEEIMAAARKAHALDFIDKLPEGMNTIIGDRGQKLSGGERQRLSIARAFLREAPILILDEATSSLDSASERAVQSALEVLMVNRTTLVIAHRLSTIRNADQILVMREGQIVERGTHQGLLDSEGEYARLHGIYTT
ncbi:MAG: ABC transporter ATP-binding protein [Bdellovibrionia bacterium]